MLKESSFWLVVVLVFHWLLLWNLQFTAWPEMLAYPYLWVEGMSLYGDFVHPYPPLLTVVLGGVFSVFGFQVEVLQGLTWVWILAGDLVLFLLARRLLKNGWLTVGVVGFYALLMSVLDGNMMWFDNALVLPVVAGGYFLVRWLEEEEVKWLLFTAVALGAAILIKQTAGLFGLVLFLTVLAWGRRERLRGLVTLVAPVMMMIIGLASYLLVRGEWGTAWNWGIYYPFSFWTKFPGYVNFHLERNEVLKLLVLVLPIFLGVFARKALVKEKKFWICLGFLGIAAVTVYPRWSFFHLQPALPFLVLIYGVIWQRSGRWSKVAMAIMVLLILGRIVWPEVRLNWGKGVRFWQESDKRLVEMMRKETRGGERVFLQGLPAHYYALSDRLPPPHWSDNFGWYLEIPGVQEWVIEGFKGTAAGVVFWRAPREGNWFDLGVYQPKKIVKYLRANYNLEREIEEGVELWRRKS